MDLGAAVAAFDEKKYLAANPDVEAAVASGALETGWAHYERYGRAEGRHLVPQPTRRDRLLAGIDLATSKGLEIGALDKPMVKKEESTIFYVDYTTAHELRKKYSSDPNVNISNIVEVDGIWGHNTLAEALGGGVAVDYVVASHVVEHVPDLVTWLREISAVLADGGTLRLAVPDRRYTFDYARRETALSDVLDAYIRKARAPLPSQILDFFLNARHVDHLAAWQGPLDLSTCERFSSDQCAMDAAMNAFQTGAYEDVHCWVFTPTSFIALMERLVELGLLDLSCEFVAETRLRDMEFMVAMRAERNPAAALESWRAARMV